MGRVQRGSSFYCIKSAREIDLIVTKSVSRFARNTVDSLTTIRQLKEKGIECYFEKENIWTFDGKGELLITIMSSLAQEESRSISENVTWGQRKRMADGKVSIPFKHTLGFKRGPKGEFLVDEEQAKTIRDIYDWFLKGLTPHAIGARLTENGVPCAIGIADACTSAAVSAISTELGRRFIPIPFLGPLTTGEGIQRGLLQK